MMINITRSDVAWLLKLLLIIEANHTAYPELFTLEEEETIKIAGQLIRGIT